jgi:hypothetical protein
MGGGDFSERTDRTKKPMAEGGGGGVAAQPGQREEGEIKTLTQTGNTMFGTRIEKNKNMETK